MDLGSEQHGEEILGKCKQSHHSDEECNVNGNVPTRDTTECNKEGQILGGKEALNLVVGQKTQLHDSN